jgi:hypothetical protein
MQLKKFNTYSHDIIFIDGLWGTGKSMLAPIVSGMKGVEKQKLNYMFEYLCILRYLNKLDPDAATAMLQTYSDIDQYHSLIGREVNLRWEDDSGVANNPGSLRYIRRMFGPEGDHIVKRINGENLALNIMSHMILPVAESLLEAFGERLKIIEVVRHPLYMVKHWLAYLSRFEGPREFTISFEIEGHKVPWFAADWYEEYINLPMIDRVLASIVKLYERLFKAIDEMNQREQQLLVISFEHMVLDPESVLKQLEQFLGRAHNPNLNKILRKQKLPRERITHGKGHAAYGWQAGIENSERDEYEKLAAFIQTSGSKKYLDSYAKLITEYNQRWPCILSQFH